MPERRKEDGHIQITKDDRSRWDVSEWILQDIQGTADGPAP